MGEFPTPGHKESAKTLTPGTKNGPNTHQAIVFNNPADIIKHETEIMKISTEMLMCLEILIQ